MYKHACIDRGRLIFSRSITVIVKIGIPYNTLVTSDGVVAPARRDIGHHCTPKQSREVETC